MSDTINIDNVRYSMETQEYFQRQLEESVNTLINKDNTESNKAFDFFMGSEGTGINRFFQLSLKVFLCFH